MNFFVQRISVGVRGFWQKLGRRNPEPPDLQTDNAIQHRVGPRDIVDGVCGRSESLDPDNVGDIADEGTGHRG